MSNVSLYLSRPPFCGIGPGKASPEPKRIAAGAQRR
jgi:hypothetical protein